MSVSLELGANSTDSIEKMVTVGDETLTVEVAEARLHRMQHDWDELSNCPVDDLETMTACMRDRRKLGRQVAVLDRALHPEAYESADA